MKKLEYDENAAAEVLMREIVKFRTLHIKGRPIEGIKPSEMFLIMHIAHWDRWNKGPGVKVSELSDHMRVKMPTITQSINSLEKRGIVERCADQADRRLVRIKLTEKGLIIAQKNERKFSDIVRELVSYLGVDQSRELSVLLSRVYKFFEIMKHEQDGAACNDEA